jgi:hypothetical protein
LVVLRSWLVGQPQACPMAGPGAEDRHSKFYDAWVNLGGVAGALFDVGGAQPTTIADLASAGLSFNFPGSFPYLNDPWDGYDNPSVQNMAVRGNP